MSSYGSGLAGLPNAIGGALVGQAATVEAKQQPRVLRELDHLRKSIVVLHHTIESFGEVLAPMTRPQVEGVAVSNSPTPVPPPASPVVAVILQLDDMVGDMCRKLVNLRESLDV